MSECQCQSVSVRVSVSECQCQSVSVRVSVSECQCVSVRVSVCQCQCVSVRVSVSEYQCGPAAQSGITPRRTSDRPGHDGSERAISGAAALPSQSDGLSTRLAVGVGPTGAARRSRPGPGQLESGSCQGVRPPAPVIPARQLEERRQPFPGAEIATGECSSRLRGWKEMLGSSPRQESRGSGTSAKLEGQVFS